MCIETFYLPYSISHIYHLMYHTVYHILLQFITFLPFYLPHSVSHIYHLTYHIVCHMFTILSTIQCITYLLSYLHTVYYIVLQFMTFLPSYPPYNVSHIYHLTYYIMRHTFTSLSTIQCITVLPFYLPYGVSHFYHLIYHIVYHIFTIYLPYSIS